RKVAGAIGGVDGLELLGDFIAVTRHRLSPTSKIEKCVGPAGAGHSFARRLRLVGKDMDGESMDR
ncbi:MAG: hypothetical protein OEQ29_17455, partial [Alphaproteobacteria bacterium]|nr:hypothetical protein [Alphaproteobacteria bacterium]